MACSCKCGGCENRTRNPEILYEILDEIEAERQKREKKHIAQFKWLGATALVFSLLIFLLCSVVKKFTGEYQMPPFLFILFSVFVSFVVTSRMIPFDVAPNSDKI